MDLRQGFEGRKAVRAYPADLTRGRPSVADFQFCSFIAGSPPGGSREGVKTEKLKRWAAHAVRHDSAPWAGAEAPAMPSHPRLPRAASPAACGPHCPPSAPPNVDPSRSAPPRPRLRRRMPAETSQKENTCQKLTSHRR